MTSPESEIESKVDLDIRKCSKESLAILKSLLEDHWAKRLAALEKAIEANDFVTAAKLAHQAKGWFEMDVIRRPLDEAAASAHKKCATGTRASIHQAKTAVERLSEILKAK